jgi:hypothetical protein
VIGVTSIAGPRTHLDYSRMQPLVPDLLAATAELAATNNVSGLFSRPP